MKNYLTTLLICLSVVGVKAQLPDGSVGPNFTVTDIEGNSHTLYDILDSGYTVVMDLNATWCGPCWSYHQAGHLETLWEEHGPAGWPGVSANTTDDVFVFMIESSSNTGLADLQGETSNSYGDWITGTHFPIVNEETVASSYELVYYPTVFTVCPNRIVTESGAISADAHYSVIGECVNAQNGKNLATFDYTGEKTTCGTNVDVKARFQNMGTDNVTAFTAEVFDGSNSIATQQYSGNSISTYGFVELDFGTVQIDGPTSLEIKITSEDVLQSDNSLNQNIVLAKEGSGNMTLQITTDNFGNQVSWEIKDLNGTTVESGGPYSNSSNTTEYDPQPQDDQSISLESDGCYFFEV
ncbi:MAG: redoxin domain-containing protein [Flavobacteriales bacterium]|nr:redoxin domain-containing protein [Flavobacteriales bacterium]